MTTLDKLKQEARESLIEYSKLDGQGLRCDRCDCKYLGRPQIDQLCVACRVDSLIDHIATTLTDEMVECVSNYLVKHPDATLADYYADTVLITKAQTIIKDKK